MYLVVSLLLSTLVLARSLLVVSARCISVEDRARCDTLPLKDNPLPLNDSVVFLYINKAVGEVQEYSFQSLKSLKNLEMYPGITNIQPGAFEDLNSLTSLNLFNNSIESLKSKTFRGCGSLKTLVLVRNNIRNIEANAFQDLSSLTFLDLSYNPNIQIFSNHIFNGLHELTFLQCVNCGLTVIEPLAFDGIPMCHGLNLRLNNLREVVGTEFELLPQLDELKLSSNYITRLDIDVLLNKNANLQRLNLANNSFSCKGTMEIQRKCHEKDVVISIFLYGEDPCTVLLTEANTDSISVNNTNTVSISL